MPIGIARLALSLGLLTPIVIVVLTMGQLPGSPLAWSTVASVGAGTPTAEERPMTRRPASTAPDAPPTLVPNTEAPKPGPQLAGPSPTPGPRTYVVQPGDQLKHIAANHGVSIWTIVEANTIPNPDSLRVGQVLTIPVPSPPASGR